MSYVWNILATSTVVTLLAATFILSQIPIYRATATILRTVEDASLDILSIRSADFLLTVVENNDLDIHPRSRLRSHLTKGFGLVSSSTSVRKMDNELKVYVLQENLNTRAAEVPPGIYIQFESPDSKLAAYTANLIATEYLRSSHSNRTTAESMDLSNNLDKAERALLTFLQNEPGVLNATNQLPLMLSKKQNVEEQATALLYQIEIQKQELQKLKTMDNPEKLAENSVFLSNPSAMRSIQKLADLKDRRQQLSSRYGPNHQKMIAVNHELLKSKNAFEIQIKNTIQKLENQLIITVDQHRVAEKQLVRLSENIDKVNSSHLKLKSLEQAVDSAKRYYEASHSLTNKITRGYTAAAVPTEPIKSKIVESLLLVFAITAITMLGLMLISAKIANLKEK